MERHFGQLLEAQWNQKKFLCVGLDPDVAKIPEAVKKATVAETMLAFNTAIIDATKDIAGSFKPNSAFYEAHGEEGMRTLKETVEYIHAVAPEVPVILDAKRADIGNTNAGYVQSFFDHMKFDAVTVHPYLGAEAIEPFLARKDKGVFVLCRTSNPGAKEFQDLTVDGEPLYMRVAKQVASSWNKNGNCGLVVGATYPAELANVHAAAPELPLLIPGIGAQGGDLEAAVKGGGKKILIVAGRAILYASNGPDFATAARTEAQKLDSAIKKALVE